MHARPQFKFAENGAADMDTLPSDVLLTIVHKLAAQDPLALLTPTRACKALLRATEDNPIWKDLFYGSAVEHGTENDWRRKCRSPGLDAEIESLCGFKQLMAARYAAKDPTAFTGAATSAEQKQARRRCLVTSKHFLTSKENVKPSKLLIIVRLEVSVLLWGSQYT